ncbi:MAG: hypothetical protein K6B28_07550 [Lachnospiraceae bacterium]|nr:hypothetical protein [Lachnospiraceae bacterium]
MNNKDLMDALSGIDPKYIEEAAFELKDEAAPVKRINNPRLRKRLFIALPTAAAILLAILVSFPAIRRLNNSEGTSMAEYESSESAEADAYESNEAASAEAYESSESALADDAESEEYMSAEAESDILSSYDQKEASGEKAEDAHNKEENTSQNISDTYSAEESPAEEASAADTSDSVSVQEAVSDEITASKSNETGSENNSYTEAATDAVNDPLYQPDSFKTVYDNGILTIETAKALPSDLETKEYIVTGKDKNGQDVILTKGILKDILKETDPLTLDLSELDLTEGTYTLSFEDENIEFSF